LTHTFYKIIQYILITVNLVIHRKVEYQGIRWLYSGEGVGYDIPNETGWGEGDGDMLYLRGEREGG
jgi:hypothetical protein